MQISYISNNGKKFLVSGYKEVMLEMTKCKKNFEKSKKSCKKQLTKNANMPSFLMIDNK